MKNTLLVIQIIVSISLITLVLLQAKGVGLGRAWGGGGEFYKSRRGVEKVIFNMTVIVAVLFLISSLANVLFA
jgi:preprotein translocase subunit SecG